MAERSARSAGCLFIQFARAPVLGQVKTRMQPRLSARAARDLHCGLALNTAWQLSRARAPDDALELWLAGGDADPWCQDLAAVFSMRRKQQRGADLGERMLHALRDGLSRTQRVVLVGSDCVDLDAAYLTLAATGLRYHDMVLGPAADGGYVLVAARRAHAALFRGIDWGSERVLEQSLERARLAGVDVGLLPTRHDLDRPEDLPRWDAPRARLLAAGEQAADESWRRLAACLLPSESAHAPPETAVSHPRS
jgi:rSAM/selenodomain-associated transferase 1